MFWVDTNMIITAALVFFRVGGILFALPVFGDNPTPVRVRILLAGAIAIGVYPMLPPGWAVFQNPGILEVTFMIARELLIGLGIGYLARTVFDGIVMAASVVGYQMGFGTANLFVQDAAYQMDGFTAFHRIIVMLIFLGLSLHHIFLNAVVDTFQVIPAGGAGFSGGLIATLVSISAKVFAIAVQLSAPIIIALLFTMAALGLIARAVPQLNVFTLSFPVSFFLGLMVYIATLPFLPEWMRGEFQKSQFDVIAAIRGFTVP